MRPSAHRQAFTLVECILTLGVIAILSLIIISVASRIRESGQRVACAVNMRNLTLATLTYCGEYHGRLHSAGTANNSGFTGNWGNLSELSFLAGYLDGLKSNGSTFVTRQIRCPGIKSGNLLFCFNAGSPADRVSTIHRLANTAQRLGVSGGLAALWSEPCVLNGQWPGANFDNGCGHRRTRTSPGVGIPWGGNVGLSDGSIAWGAFTATNISEARVTYLMNGGAVGGSRAIPSCTVTATCDASGNLDVTVRPNNNLIVGGGSVQFDSNYF